MIGHGHDAQEASVAMAPNAPKGMGSLLHIQVAPKKVAICNMERHKNIEQEGKGSERK